MATGERGDLLGLALERFGARLAGGAAPSDARSGAGVHRVLLPGGGAAYLKVTVSDGGDGPLAAARRELRFYRDVAGVVPVRTPPLLDALVVDDGVALLLGDAGGQRDVAAWSQRQWRALGRELARLHTMPLPLGDWDRPDALLAALADTKTGTSRDGVVAFWSAHLPQLDELLDGRDALGDRLRAVAPVFVHGDCHTGNVVHRRGGSSGNVVHRRGGSSGGDGGDSEGDDDGGSGLVLCDWQESGTGRAVSDLALLSVRATPSGTRVPRGVVHEYVRECERRGVVHDAVELRRALALEELAVLVFLWPPFAGYNDAAGIARVRRRARYLADRVSGRNREQTGPFRPLVPVE